MYQNAIYICISWYKKLCWFPLKKCWCQQNSGGVSLDSYNFWIFFRKGITLPSFIILEYVRQILGRPFCPPHPWAAPKISIKNRVNRNRQGSKEPVILLQFVIICQTGLRTRPLPTARAKTVIIIRKGKPVVSLTFQEILKENSIRFASWNNNLRLIRYKNWALKMNLLQVHRSFLYQCLNIL